ncbi:transporter substrate-binding domain-containing protein [Aliiroseovarius sp. KMU-50]|uniref:Transporter substrate-binding domain-containing protein n=1 Tax=Aliiroseovarius salicola TaxID=3009082 RepID=A0ABT4W608_9RHOB|nr:transporter substrate-binding domain-containing protein [Aliiroseovarius sp. KMU-50]MDA5095869.1 transporter substrate-binding domain-containing protein [Aliiroseovarius sp. KMU-50]
MRKFLIASSLVIAATTGTASAQEACSDYVVKRGDSLRELALKVFGTFDYRIIYNANRERIGRDPNIIRIGTTLKIPCLPEEDTSAEDVQTSEDAVVAVNVAAKEAIKAVPAEDAAMPRDAEPQERPGIHDRQLLMITGGNYAPFTDEKLPNRGLYTHLVETALLRAAPEQSYKIQFVNDWSSHLDLLMPTLAFDATFPWSRPKCEEAEALSDKDRARCETYNFSDPFYEVVDTYFAKDGSGYEATRTHADFAGATFCRPEGWSLSHMDAVGLYEPAIKLLRPVEPDECFHAVMDGRVDIVAIEAHLAVKSLRRLGYEHQIIENPNLAAIKSLNVMTHKDNPDGEAILGALNQGLEIMQKSGEWRDIISSALRHQMENG